MLTSNFCTCSEGFSSFRRDDIFPVCGMKSSSNKHGCSFPGSMIFAEFIATLGAVKMSQMQSNNNEDDMLLG